MSRSKTSSSLELLLPLDRVSPEPLHRQLEHGLRAAVRDGRLAPGATLPSSRGLAAQLGVSRGIVVEAYEQLVAEGYLASRPGGATRVAWTPRPPRPVRESAEPDSVAFDFRPGRPDVTEFPRATWLRALRRALATAPSDRLTYLGGRGVPELRLALAAYLNRVRGTSVDPADVVVSAGFAQGLRLVAQVLRATGARRFAVEDPSDPEYRTTLREVGIVPVAVPVDEAGLRVDQLETLDVDGVLVTAAHQYPTGAVLSPDRRAALVAWARRRRATIVEDDYDAEFRYDRDPVGALQGLSPDRVVYTGTTSKTLAPGLRLGWIVAPPEHTEALVAAKQAADMGSPAMDQLAFAELLARGDLDHHLRRMRPVYRRRRDALLGALARHLPELRPVGAAAGLHVLAWLPDDMDAAHERAIVDRAAEEGIALGSLSPRRIAPGPAGLVFGYGTIVEPAIEPGIARLAPVIAAVREGRAVRGGQAGGAGQAGAPVRPAARAPRSEAAAAGR